MPRRAILPALAALLAATFAVSAQAASPQVEHGKYLVALMGCTDCHTPGHFLGHPDETRYLGGSDVGFGIPNLGVFVGPNLTPDKETGLGGWSDEQIEKALTTGERPDGRILAPIMPWHALAHLSKPDQAALVAYLRGLPPVRHKVAGPFGPNEKPTVFVMKVVPPPEGVVPSEPPPKP